ncbi:MAG: hypothetical protein AB6733_08470 [Clostridiaceae bacterium]
MFEVLKIELIDANEKLRRKKKYESLANQTNETLQKELDRKIELEHILKIENEDVKKLESLSITSIFHSILGSKDQQLEKERQELLAARLRYEECCNSVSVLESELLSYKTSLNSLIDADYEYKTALKRKEKCILLLNDGNSQTLHKLLDKLADLEVQKKELKEAIEAGENVQSKLENVIDSLKSAEGWGTWDMLGGGFIATAAKHSHIDEAKVCAHDAKVALIRFQNELSDVNLTMDIDINVDSFEKFADYFFDGLISDWIVQSRIHDSLDSVESVSDNVDSVLDSLKEKFRNVQIELLTTEEKIKLLVEKA